MPRARSPNRDKAFELWKESGKSRTLKEIAQELGVSESQVRKWKNLDKWDEAQALPNVTKSIGNAAESKGNVTIEEKTPKRKRGGQKGNKNRYVHGLYANPTMDMIPQEELNRLSQMNFDNPAELLIDEIMLLTADGIHSKISGPEKRVISGRGNAQNGRKRRDKGQPLQTSGNHHQDQRRI